ncbi:MAG: adenylate/guanylate cyclase domain-containing protein, partial [Nitrospinota bacterium]
MPRRAVSRPPLKLRLDVKIAVHTMAMVALTVVLMGWLHYGKVREEILGLYQDHLLHIATTAALSVDAEAHAVLFGKEARKWPALQRMREYLIAVKEENRLETPISTLRRVGEDEAEYVVTTHAMARIGTRRPLSPAARPAFERGEATVTGLYANERGTWMSAYAPIKLPSGEVEAVLAIDYRADKLVAELAARRRLTVLYGGVVLVVALVLSIVLARTITRHLKKLLEAARALARGDYEHQVEVTGRDEVGDLAAGFEMMRRSLKEARVARDRLTTDLRKTVKELEDNLEKVQMLEKVKSQLAKFVPGQVVRLIEEAPERPALQKQQMDVSVLFLDVVGYTRLSEEVDRNRMDYILERYFSNYVDTIQANGGEINETAGDGLMILFHHPAPAEHAIRAVSTARAIQTITEAINAEEAIIHADEEGDFRPIGIKVGINSGESSVGVSRFEGLGEDRYTFT